MVLQTFSGMVIGVMILCGFVGSAATGIMADRTKAFTPITKLCYGCAAIFAVIMLEVSGRCLNRWNDNQKSK